MSWQPTRRAEQEYAKTVYSALKRFFFVAKAQTAQAITAGEFLARYAEQAALRMVSSLYFAGARSWREAARKSGNGQLIAEELKKKMSGATGRRVRRLVRANAELIRSLPTQVEKRAIARAALATAQAGGRSRSLVGEGLESLSRAAAVRLARTEVSKANTALVQSRAEQLDLPWYIWRTSEDERVRPSHRKMANVLIRWDNPPAPEHLIGQKSTLGHYNAGNCPNDRCYGEPFISMDQVKWPHRVYYGNSIQYMTRSQFERINDLRRTA